jgi:non-specific serine/threonine protein kinase
MIGKTISHYRITEKLGAGEMGVVYKAEDTKLKRTVALKFLPFELTRDQDAKTRFLREARVASSLQHHNICTIHEIDETADGQLFIVMDCYDGETLGKMIASGPLPLDEAIKTISQAAEGLSEAHASGMVHRDFKPANIMVTDKGVVKILDFGVAKLVGQTKVTRKGGLIGTIAFMSPEQARGEDIDSRSDIFSLGSVFYNLLTGRLPFEADHEATVIFRINSQVPEPLATHMGSVPNGLQRVIDKMLEKDRNMRYQSIGDLLQDLDVIGDAVAAGGKVRGLVAGKRRRTLIAGLGFILFFAAAVFTMNKYFLPEKYLDPLAGIMIAVLPFENFGPPDDEYFVNGITEAVAARLTGITGLSVISRQSTMQYKDSSQSIREIGDELGVDYILAGSVQRERSSDPDSRVRVIPQLIRVADDVHIWVDTYNEEMKGIFGVQSEIAEHVAMALDVTLLGRDRRELGKIYTENIEAYEHYLRGVEHAGVFYDKNVHKAEASFERAIKLDPEFAMAWAGLSMARSWMYPSNSAKHLLTSVKAAADRALELDPDLPEAHMALGLHYYRCLQDYRGALRHLAAAQRRRPSDERIIRNIAHIHRRMGMWDLAIELYEKALVLNPKMFMTHFSLGQTYRFLRRYEDAERLLTQAIAISPVTSVGYLEKEALYLSWDGDTQRAEQVMEDAIRMAGSKNLPGRYYSSLTRILYAGSRDVSGQLDQIILSVHEEDTTDYFFNKAVILEQMGEKERSLSYYDSLQTYLEGVSSREETVAPILESFQGFACAKLGRGFEAIRHGEIATRHLPVSKDAVLGPFALLVLSATYAEVGEHDKAIEQLEFLLSIPGEVSPNMLRIDPVWDPLRKHPRFQSLVN